MLYRTAMNYEYPSTEMVFLIQQKKQPVLKHFTASEGSRTQNVDKKTVYSYQEYWNVLEGASLSEKTVSLNLIAGENFWSVAHQKVYGENNISEPVWVFHLFWSMEQPLMNGKICRQLLLCPREQPMFKLA